MIHSMRAAIFDLDGVIVDTAKYHYLAWKRLAKQLGFDFTEKENERLKGVSRMRSLEILLEIGNRTVDEPMRQELSTRKNMWYVEYISQIQPSEVLPGVVEYLNYLRGKGVKTAIASASKNAPIILGHLQIQSLFDAVIDGTLVQEAKPDPEVFLRAAESVGVPPEDCVVFEDAEAGVEAAKRAGMGCVGVGKPSNLSGADMVISDFQQLLVVNCLSPE